MSNKVKKLIALMLALVMVFALAACNTSTDNNGGDTNNGGSQQSGGDTTGGTSAGNGGSSSGTTDGGEEVVVPTFTYNVGTSSLGNKWNQHTWETSAEDAILDYIASPFVDMSILDSEEGVYQWVYEMATEVNDVTASHQADLTKYNVALPADTDPSSVTEGYVFEIKLNPNAKWQDGTPINADTYIYSMKALLDPAMHNYRANNYYSGESALAGAEAYYFAGSSSYLDSFGAYAITDLVANDDGTYSTADGALVYIGLAFPLDWTSGNTLQDYVDAYGEQYFDVTNWETLIGMADENGLIPLTDDNLALFSPVVTTVADWGETEADLPNYLVISRTYPEAEYDATVGCYKVDDYTIIYVNNTYIDFNYFLTSLTSNWLVYEDLYEAGKDTTGTLVTTDYCTSVETTMAYGPYMLESLQKDKQMVFVQNPNWYGWEEGEDGTLVSYTQFDVDGEKVQQYRTTRIVIDVVDEAAEKQAFLKGELSTWAPNAEELVNYATSDQLYKVDETYTQRLFFHANVPDLQAMDASMGNTNSVVLSNTKFRKAFSLAVDRAEFVTATPGYKAAYSMLNSLYFYDVYNDPTSSYRNSDEAMQAICNLYGVEYGAGKAYPDLKSAYNSINGYNLTEAQQLMKEACEELVADGLYTAGDPIYIRIAYKKGAMDSTDNNQVALLNKYINAAVEGSGFGTVTLEGVGNLENRYLSTSRGEFAIGWGAWGGAAFYPFTMFRVYCDEEYVGYIHEIGCWDPSVATATFTVNGEQVTKTWKDWSNSMTGTGDYATADFDVKLSILAQMEEAYLGYYYCFPVCATTACELLSFKNSYYTEDYNIMYGFGGLRLLSYNYDDAEWTEFVASQGGELHYE